MILNSKTKVRLTEQEIQLLLVFRKLPAMDKPALIKQAEQWHSMTKLYRGVSEEN